MNGISKASASIICNMTHTTPLYPLLFENNFHTIVWGGNSLKPLKGLPKDNDTIGESWEVSAVPSSKSVVKNGPLAGHDLEELTAEYGELLLGKAVMEKYGKKFPILIKFIDAKADLSVQVHPDDEYAKKYENSYGKTEAWYILDCDEGAELIYGFNKAITRDEFKASIEDNTFLNYVNKVKVKILEIVKNYLYYKI